MELECVKALGLINEYVDGELNADDAEFVRSHLKKCPDCRSAYGELKKIENLLADSAENAPAELYDRIMDQIRAEAPAKKRAVFTKRWGMVAIAAVICLSVLSTPTLLMLITGGARAECDAPDAALEDCVIENSASGNIKFDGKYNDNGYTVTEMATEEDAESPEMISPAESIEILEDITVSPVDGEYPLYLVSGKKTTVVIDTKNKTARIGETIYKFTFDGNYRLTNGKDKLRLAAVIEEKIYFKEIDERN